jgi:hypothetical protein
VTPQLQDQLAHRGSGGRLQQPLIRPDVELSRHQQQRRQRIREQLCGGRSAHLIGHRDNASRVRHDVLLPRARDPDRDHPLTHPNALDPFAECVDYPDALHSQNRREPGRKPISTTQNVQIGRVNRCRLHTDAHLAFTRLGHGAGL